MVSAATARGLDSLEASVTRVRRALGPYYQGLLAEAAALAPEAGLVKEALTGA